MKVKRSSRSSSSHFDIEEEDKQPNDQGTDSISTSQKSVIVEPEISLIRHQSTYVLSKDNIVEMNNTPWSRSSPLKIRTDIQSLSSFELKEVRLGIEDLNLDTPIISPSENIRSLITPPSGVLNLEVDFNGPFTSNPDLKKIDFNQN